MLDETGDLLDSPIAGRVVRTMIDSGFGMLVEERVGDQVFRKLDEVSSAVEGTPKIEVTEPGSKERGGGQRSQSEEEEERETKQFDVEKTAKLASVLAVLTREASAIGGRAPNDYLRVLLPPSPSPPLPSPPHSYPEVLHQPNPAIFWMDTNFRYSPFYR